MTTIEYFSLPANWASALVNGDYSGLNNKDKEAVKNWLDETAKKYKSLSCVSASEETYFGQFNNMGCELMQYAFIVTRHAETIPASFVHNLAVKIMNDEDPETSYLEQDEFKERYEQYKNDQFSFVGVKVVAEVYTKQAAGGYRSHTIESGGLWGIESDSGKEYFAEVANDEAGQLKDELQKLNIDMAGGFTIFEGSENEQTISSFDELVKEAIPFTVKF